MGILHWIDAPDSAKEAILEVTRADNRVYAVVDGSARWNSGWTSGNPPLDHKIPIPIPRHGHTDIVVLGANGGLWVGQ